MFTEAFLDIQEILDRNYRLEQEWKNVFFPPSNTYTTKSKTKNTSSL